MFQLDCACSRYGNSITYQYFNRKIFRLENGFLYILVAKTFTDKVYYIYEGAHVFLYTLYCSVIMTNLEFLLKRCHLSL